MLSILGGSHLRMRINNNFEFEVATICLVTYLLCAKQRFHKGHKEKRKAYPYHHILSKIKLKTKRFLKKFSLSIWVKVPKSM